MNIEHKKRFYYYLIFIVKIIGIYGCNGSTGNTDYNSCRLTHELTHHQPVTEKNTLMSFSIRLNIITGDAQSFHTFYSTLPFLSLFLSVPAELNSPHAESKLNYFSAAVGKIVLLSWDSQERKSNCEDG